MATVEPVTPDWAEALAEGDEVFEQRFGVPVVAGWDAFGEVTSLLLKAVNSGTPPEWGRTSSSTTTARSWATADGRARRSTALRNWAMRWHPLDAGRASPPQWSRRSSSADARQASGSYAHIRWRKSASTSVLRRCGFSKIAELDDPDEGKVWRWELVGRP